VKIRLSKNDHDGISHGVECRQEASDRITPLKSNKLLSVNTVLFITIESDLPFGFS